MDVIKQIETLHFNNELEIKSSDEIASSFIEKFKNIFSGHDINVAGTIAKPYFKAKDVLKILGYSENKNTIRSFIYDKIPDKYKKELGELLVVNDLNKAKHIYISEGGLNRLIMRSNKPNAREFQEFVEDVLLPNIRKTEINKYSNTISSLKNDLKTIINHSKQILESNNELKIQNMQILESNDKLVKLMSRQDIELKNIKEELSDTKESYHETKETLDETNENLSNLNQIIKTELLPNRNLPPDNEQINHYFILYRVKDKDKYLYYFVRGQLIYIQNIIKSKNIKTENILIDLSKNTNPIDFLNKLKEKSKALNNDVKKNIKTYIETHFPNISKEDFKCKEKYYFNSKNKYFEIKTNKLILNRNKIEDILNFYEDLISEKNTIITEEQIPV